MKTPSRKSRLTMCRLGLSGGPNTCKGFDDNAT